MKVQESSAKLKSQLDGISRILTNKWLGQAGEIRTTIINKFNKTKK